MAPGLERTEASSYSITDLLVLVVNGGIRIPHFQRGQRWGPGDVVKLFDSIYKGYPIGTLLLWKRPAQEAVVTLGSVRIQAPEHTEAYWVVDGQQRITSLASALLPADGAVAAEPALYFDLNKERFGWDRQRGPRDVHLPVREAHKLPRVMAWLRERDLDERMQERAFKLADRLRNYKIPSYSVETELEGDMAPLREIFDRINTFGKRMNRAEVFHALTSLGPPGGRDLSHLANEIGAWGYGVPGDNTLMLCVLSVRGPDVLRDFRTEFTDDSAYLSETIDQAEVALHRTITFLRREARVPHFDLVQYQHLLVALVRLFALHDNPSEWERVLLRRWYWRAALHGPLPKLGSTGTLRLALNTIDRSSVNETVVKLLELFPSERRQAMVHRFQGNRADTKTVLCAMANLHPMIPIDPFGEAQKIDVAQVLSADPISTLPRVFPLLGGDHGASSANRVFWPSGKDGADSDNLAIVLASSTSRILASHAISEPAAKSLRRGDAGAFLVERRSDIRRVVDDFVDARAEWERSARPALASL